MHAELNLELNTDTTGLICFDFVCGCGKEMDYDWSIEPQNVGVLSCAWCGNHIVLKDNRKNGSVQD